MTLCNKCGSHCETFGDCIRNKGLRIGYCRSAAGIDRTADKAWNSELALYANARGQGIQPEGTQTAQIRAALDASDKSGVAFNAGEV